MKPGEGPDQRLVPRHQTRIYGVFKRDIDPDETEMLLTNMSLGGAFVRTENPAPPGTMVTLRIYLSSEEPPISVGGEVVWWRLPGHGEPAGMGVKFVRISPGDLEKVKAFLAELVEEDLFGR